MKVRYVAEAAIGLDRIAEHVARDNPYAAERLVRRIRQRVIRLAESGFARMGSPGRVRGTRQLVVGRYVVVYRHDPARDEILVLSVVHGARRR